jgi:hypothetical protein
MKVVCGPSMQHGVADALKTKRDCSTQSQVTWNKGKTYLVPHEVLVLSSYDTFFALRVPLRNHVTSKVFAQVFDNGFRLGDDDLLTPNRCDANYRALS